MKLPQRIFLDTSVVNFIVEYSENIFDGSAIIDTINDRVYDDVLGLTQIFYYANHNPIEMIISRTTFDEIQATSDSLERERLINYCS